MAATQDSSTHCGWKRNLGLHQWHQEFTTYRHFLSWYFQTPEPLPLGCTGRGRRRRQKSFSGMDSSRDGTEGIPTCWTSQPSVFKQFSVNCSCRAKLSHSPSHLRHHKLPLPSPVSVPVRHSVLPYHTEDAGRRAYITYICIFKVCLHPASKQG